MQDRGLAPTMSYGVPPPADQSATFDSPPGAFGRGDHERESGIDLPRCGSTIKAAGDGDVSPPPPVPYHTVRNWGGAQRPQLKDPQPGLGQW